MVVKLVVRRSYVPYEFLFDSTEEAIEEAIRQMGSGLAYPDRIKTDGDIIWKSESPISDYELLKDFKKRSKKKSK